MNQCEAWSEETGNMRCCYHEGHSGDHYYSNADESDRIRWKLAADARDELRAFVTELAEEGCSYNDNCPGDARHYRCLSCKAKAVLERANGANQ